MGLPVPTCHLLCQCQDFFKIIHQAIGKTGRFLFWNGDCLPPWADEAAVSANGSQETEYVPQCRDCQRSGLRMDLRDPF